MRTEGESDPNYCSEVCYQLKISHSLGLKNAKYDNFWNFEKIVKKFWFTEKKC